ncbi:TIGR00266 family protein [Pyrolobus fumarii]|nr:TIGR00266 family protein [Pyrolobus fumarii]
MQYRIEHGPAYAVLKVRLEAGESIWAEPGAMMLLRGPVRVETRAYGGVLTALKRALFGGESFFLNRYVAEGPAEVWLVPGTPGDIATIDMQGGGSWIVQDTSYLAHSGDINVDVAWRGLRGLIAEGEIVWLKLEGRGLAWISSYGAIDKIDVPPGEKVVIDNFHFVAMSADAKWSVRKFGDLKSFIFGGEGFVIEIEGPATVYVQSRMLPLFARLLQKFLPRQS